MNERMNIKYHHAPQVNSYNTDLHLTRPRPHFLLHALLESAPPFLPGEGLESAVDPVLHHGDELLVGEHAVAVVVEDLVDDVHQVRAQLAARADRDGSGK